VMADGMISLIGFIGVLLADDLKFGKYGR